MLQPARYVAVDISVEFLRNALLCLQRQFPALPMTGVGLDFSASLALPPALLERPRRCSSTPARASATSRPSRRSPSCARCARWPARSGGLLIGVDRVKPRELLEPAYADALGVTAAFNLNLLLHLNRLLGADFALVRLAASSALWNAAQSRVEMHLQARRAVTVRWAGGERRFAEGERIHTENSYKYRPADFDALLRDAGFSRTVQWSDAKGWFSVVWAARPELRLKSHPQEVRQNGPDPAGPHAVRGQHHLPHPVPDDQHRARLGAAVLPLALADSHGGRRGRPGSTPTASGPRCSR